MDETPEQLAALQDLVDRSFASASQHLRSIMTPPRRLTATRLAAELPSPAVLDIATVTASGEPRVSAVDGHFIGGSWYFTTAGDSPKARHLAARPAISAAYTPRDGFGVFCHGTAALLAPGAERQPVIDRFVAVYGQSPEDWGDDIAYVRIDAHWMVGFAMADDELAAIEADRAARAQR